MKIAILTSGIMPVPAVQGGAVENLVDFYLEYNDRHQIHDITIYSAWAPNVKRHPALKSNVNHYKYIKTNSLFASIWKKLFRKKYEGGYYHYTIEYFCEQVIQDLRKYSYDIILIENRPAFGLKLKNSSINSKIVYHIHNAMLDNTIDKAKEIYDAASRIICVSDYITQCVQAIRPNEQKCMTIHNGIDLGSFNYKATLPVSRKEYGFSTDDFILLFSGRLTSEKGIMHLINALKILKDHPQIKLLILGSTFYGNSCKSEFADKLMQEIKKMQSRILFSGFVPYNRIPSFLAMVDLAVIPSFWDDPFPTTVLEAQAMGKPIITTKRGGIPEEVSENNAIILETDENFIVHLAQSILELYSNPQKRNFMAEESVKRAALFNKVDYAKNIFNALENIDQK